MGSSVSERSNMYYEITDPPISASCALVYPISLLFM